MVTITCRTSRVYRFPSSSFSYTARYSFSLRRSSLRRSSLRRLTTTMTFDPSPTTSGSALIQNFASRVSYSFFQVLNRGLAETFFSFDHVGSDLCARFQRLFPDVRETPLEQRRGRSKQTAEDRSDSVPPLRSRSREDAVSATALTQVVIFVNVVIRRTTVRRPRHRHEKY